MFHNHDYLRFFLRKTGYKINDTEYGEHLYEEKIFDLFNIGSENRKGVKKYERYVDILSDPNNLFIERHKDAGLLEDNIITLHNGIKLYADYYGDFIDILKYNLGVHEPSEERAFQKVLSVLKPESIMVELGSYWSMYSLWFRKTIKNSRSFCFESVEENLNLGQRNFDLNNIEGEFVQAEIGIEKFNLCNYLKNYSFDFIDILHSDIQGNELEMLDNMSPFFEDQKIKYVFISTHSQILHESCIEFLNKKNYKILCSCDFDNETYHCDGFILSCPENLNEINPFFIGNRSVSYIFSDQELNEFLK